METYEFIKKLEDMFDYRVKIKHAHTTKGDTWESTVKAKDEHEALEIIKEIDRKMREFVLVKVEGKPKLQEVINHAEP